LQQTNLALLKEGIPVQCQNNSTNATTFLWDFGNNEKSTTRNPVYKYSDQGIYTVSLTASSAQNKNTISKKITVIDTILLGDAYISFAPNEYNQKEVNFFAVARNAKQFEWDFGDGEMSNEKEPVHTFAEYKDYTISLKVSTETEEKSTTKTIKILDPQYIVSACFEWEIDSINPYTVHFTNFSENATHYNWNFYDQGESIEENPSYTFIEENELFALVTLFAFNDNDGYDQVFHCIPEECQLVGKPNIYLYPESIIQLQLSISFPQGGKIDKSIPEHGNGWNVIIESDGLIDRQHDYLFYESTQPDNFQNEEGWSIAQVDLLEFFETNMALYKFNEKEIHDFTKYWIPRLINSDYFNIYPQCNKILDEVIALNFSIEPDNIMRLVYLIEPVNQKIDLPTPSIPRFSRNGFDVMEWGVTY
jgi:PKD repeat protein